MTKAQGWHGESKKHAEAAKGSTPAAKSDNSKDSTKAQGWHGDSNGHAEAAKGESKNDNSIKSKLFGS